MTLRPMQEEEATATSSTVTATATTGSHTLKMEGYTMIRKSHPKDTCVTSAKFKAAGHTWSISFYPNGRTTKTTSWTVYSHVGLKLHGSGAAIAGDGVQASVSFRMGSSTPYKEMCSIPMSFTKRKMHCDFCFINREDLESSGCIKDDSLVIRCDIAVVEKTAVLDPAVVRPLDDEESRSYVVSGSSVQGPKEEPSFKPFCVLLPVLFF